MEIDIDEEIALHSIHTEETRQSSAFSGADLRQRHHNVIDQKASPEVPLGGQFRVPLNFPDVQRTNRVPSPRLLHPILLKYPIYVRFGLVGFLNNVLFMITYDSALDQLKGLATSSTIYSIVYLIFIPVGHACTSLFVFGWPERYIPSLMSNAPVGLSALAIGAVLTSYLEKMDFNKYVVDFVARNWRYMGYAVENSQEQERGEFYSSLLVLIVTGIWTFALSFVINSSPTKPSLKKMR